MTLVGRVSENAHPATLIIDMCNFLMETLIIEFFFLHVFGNWKVVEP